MRIRNREFNFNAILGLRHRLNLHESHCFEAPWCMSFDFSRDTKSCHWSLLLYFSLQPVRYYELQIPELQLFALISGHQNDAATSDCLVEVTTQNEWHKCTGRVRERRIKAFHLQLFPFYKSSWRNANHPALQLTCLSVSAPLGSVVSLEVSSSFWHFSPFLPSPFVC